MAIYNTRAPAWTAEEDRQLAILWQAEWSTLSIAVTIGRSKNAICARARRIGLPERESPISIYAQPIHSSNASHAAAAPNATHAKALASMDALR